MADLARKMPESAHLTAFSSPGDLANEKHYSVIEISKLWALSQTTRKPPLDVFSSVIFTEDNNYWVMWLFMNGTQSGLDDLRKNIRIAFAPSNSVTDQSKTN